MDKQTLIDWQPMTTRPPRPGQYHARIRIGAHSIRTMVRYWDGQQWLSPNGKLPTGFGNWGDLTQQWWHEIGAGDKEQ